MRKIVIISPEIPYPTFKGNQHRINLTIEAFLDIGAEVHLACLNSSQLNRSNDDVLKDLKKAYPSISAPLIFRQAKREPRNGVLSRVLTWIRSGSGSSFISERSCSVAFRGACRKFISDLRPDVVFVNYIKLSGCIPEAFSGTKIVDLHDIQSNIIKAARENQGFSIKSGEYLDYLKNEVELVDSYDQVISINGNESDFLGRFIEPDKIFTLPGCSRANFGSGGSVEYDIGFLGSASSFNIEGIMKFDAQVMPVLKRIFPDIRVAIAGDVSNCMSVSKLDPSIYKRLGRIDDLSSFYRSSKIIISPIVSGAGMKVKNIEAMSFGKAIVATSFSMDGISVVDGKSALVSVGWREFADDVTRLLSDDHLRERIETQVREVFRHLYSYERKRDFYRALFNDHSVGIGEGRCSGSSKLSLNSRPSLFAGGGSVGENRTKALIFSMDAHELIDFNLFLAKELNKCGVYSEFVRVESYGSAQFLDAGFIVHGIRKQLCNARRKILREELKAVIDVDGNFTEILYRDVDIADDILVYRRMFPRHFEETTVINIVVHSFLLLDALCLVVGKVNPSFLVGWNGNGPQMVFLMKVLARVFDLPIFHVERGLLPASLVFDAQGVNFKSVFAGSFLPLINQKQRNAAKRYIDGFRERSISIVVNSEQRKMSRGDLFTKFSVGESGYVFFPMQIEGDSNLIINSSHYKKMTDVVDDLSKVTRSLGLSLICRPHPENKQSEAEVTAMVADLGDVHIDSSVDLHTMIKNSVATVIINSTVGLESLLHGVPTISLGNSIYSSKGMTHDCVCAEHIRGALDEIVNYSISSQFEDELDFRLQRLVHLLVSEYLLFYDESEWASSNINKLESMLLRGGIIPSKTLGEPGLPEAVVSYRNRCSALIVKLKSKKSLTVKSLLPEGTMQYFNGSKRVLVTNSLIIRELERLYGFEVTLVDGGQCVADIVILKEKVPMADIYPSSVVMNEFFEIL